MSLCPSDFVAHQVCPSDFVAHQVSAALILRSSIGFTVSALFRMTRTLSSYPSSDWITDLSSSEMSTCGVEADALHKDLDFASYSKASSLWLEFGSNGSNVRVISW